MTRMLLSNDRITSTNDGRQSVYSKMQQAAADVAVFSRHAGHYD